MATNTPTKRNASVYADSLTVTGNITAPSYNNSNWDAAYGWGDHSAQNYATQTYVTNTINSLVDSAPGTLDTLNELAAALGDDPNFATTVSTNIGTKVSKSGDTMTGTLTAPTGVFNNLTIGTSNKIKFANNDYIRYDDANGVGRFHFDCDGGTNNASVQAATFVGALSGNASTSSKWTTARTNTVTLTGDVTGSGSASVDGTGNWTVSVDTSLASNADWHWKYITYDNDAQPASTSEADMTSWYKNYFIDITESTLASYPVQYEGYVNTYDVSTDGTFGGSSGAQFPASDAYHAHIYTNIYVERPFTVTNSAFAGDDDHALFINGKFVSGSVSTVAPAYSYTFKKGWHRIDLIYSEQAGGDYIRLGWNPKDYTSYITDMTPHRGADNPQYTLDRLLDIDGSGSGLDADTVDGLHASSFASASHTHSYLPLSGGTVTGNVTLSGADGENALTLTGTSPTLAFTDSGSEDDFYIHVNSNNFYILGDAGGAGSYGAWDSPHPLQLERDTSIGYMFGQRVFADNYHPNADKWTTARTHTVTLTGDVSGTASQSVDGTGNKSWVLNTAVADDSHFHHRLDSTDDRDVKPNTSGIGSGVQAIKPFFTSLGGMTGSANGDWQDLLVLDTYPDTSGGKANAITMDKSDGAMRIWNANQTATSWGTGQRVFADNYHPSADKWTTARTLSLTGDVTGSVSWDGSSNVTLSAQVANDSHTHDGRYVNVTGDTMTGTLVAPEVRINDGNTRIHEGGGNSVRVTTNSGWLEIGPHNTGHAHIQTDRTNFYFNKEVVVDTGIIGSYNEDLYLRRGRNSAHQIRIAAGTTTISQNTVIQGSLTVSGSISQADGFGTLYTFNTTQGLSTSWADVTAIAGNALPTGTYAIQIFINNSDVGGHSWSEYYSGTMSWYGSSTNDGDSNEIPLHNAGHAQNGPLVYARTLRRSQSTMILQLAASGTVGSDGIQIKLRRLI